MGIDDRDYARHEPEYRDYQGGSGGFANPFAGEGVVTKRIIIITVAVFLLQAATQKNGHGGITDWLRLSLPGLKSGYAWQLVTYAFCHSVKDIFHIIFNLLFVWWFGKTLETMYGSREFLFFYIAAAVTAGLAYVGLDLATGGLGGVVGASGAVMAIMMVYACHFPRQKILLMMIIPVEIRWMVLGYVVFSMFPVVNALAGKGSSSNIAHSAHLGGLLFGYLYYRFHWRLSDVFGQWKLPNFSRTFGARRNIKIYSPPSNVSDDKEVDAILEKISEQGIESLTKKERKKLERASKEANRRMKNP